MIFRRTPRSRNATVSASFSFQALYGSGASDNDDDSTSQGSGKKTTTQEPPGAEGSDAELCTDTKVNALFNSAGGETFVFKGTGHARFGKISAGTRASGKRAPAPDTLTKTDQRVRPGRSLDCPLRAGVHWTAGPILWRGR